PRHPTGRPRRRPVPQVGEAGEQTPGREDVAAGRRGGERAHASLDVMTTPLQNISINTLSGEPTNLGAYDGHAVLVVNVASKCGLTPQYTALDQLAQEYADRGL